MADFILGLRPRSSTYPPHETTRQSNRDGEVWIRGHRRTARLYMDTDGTVEVEVKNTLTGKVLDTYRYAADGGA